jgi:cytochrome c553
MHKRNAFLAVAALCVAFAATAAQADGKAKAMVCTACHGADGNSSNPIWPNLAAQNPAYIVAQLKAFKAGTRQNASMAPMVASLEPGDMVEIAAFFAAQTLKVKPLAADQVAAAEAGQKLYRGGDAERGIPACMACHGPDGGGNPASGYPALRGQQFEYTVAQLQNYHNGTRQTDAQQMMRTIAQRLTEDDIKNLARYVSALH